MRHAFLTVFTLLICLSASLAATQPVSPDPTRVLVISLDGARPDALILAETPNIRDLARRGAAAWAATTIMPPVTLPAHTSMLTGLSPEDHGVDWNDTQPECQPVVSAPTFLTLAAEAGYQTAMVVGKSKFCHLLQSDQVDYTFAREGDRSVADRVIELLKDDFQVIFAHFPNPDYFGHLNGWMSDAYMNGLNSTDTQVGRVLAALDELGLTDESLVMITADHGGHGTTHGQDIPEDRQIPWIIAGPGVIPDTTLEVEVSVADTAATVLWALGLDLPENSLGRPVYEAFSQATAISPVGMRQSRSRLTM